MITRLPLRSDEDALRRCLERTIPAILGRPAAITAIQRQRSDYSSSYHSDILTVQLDTGEALQIFAKNLGVTQFPKDGAKQRRDRELGVYRDLLAETHLGTPQYYGSVWDEPQGTFWLLLEFVNGWTVKSYDIGYWVAAAGWLGRLHGCFARHVDRLNACDFLIRHDADFFWSKAEPALREVCEISLPLASRLAPVLDGYKRLAEVMAGQARTLVHGAYRPCNIVVDVHSDPVRICPVDWELAALGSALYDLAFFSDGFQPPILDQLFEAYRQEALEQNVAVPDREEMRYVFDCFRLFRAVSWLSRARAKGFSEQKVAQLVDLSEKLHARIAAKRDGV